MCGELEGVITNMADADQNTRVEHHPTVEKAPEHHGKTKKKHPEVQAKGDSKSHPRPASKDSKSRPTYEPPKSKTPARPPKLADLKTVKDIHKVRSYSLTKKGLVNRGEHYVSRSPSELSVCSSSSRDTNVSIMPVEPSKVLLVGASGVGKRALIHEFMDPDTMINYFQSTDDDADRTVSILLDGQESTMEFVDMSDREVDEFVTADQIDAYVVVYSVEDRKSFETAIDRLFEIRQQESRHIALILVANKTDLVRTRVILEEEGRSAAKTYDCKYIEVSAAIDHRIDELLVGILKQIRLIKERTAKHVKKKKPGVSHSVVDNLDTCCLLRARENVLAKLFRGEKATSKSCDNLYVL